MSGKPDKEILSKDFLFSLFYSAVHSYKCDTLIRPFPSSYKDGEDQKDFDALKEEISSIHGFGDDDWTTSHNTRMTSLVHNIINPKKFKLKFHTNTAEAFERIRKETNDGSKDLTTSKMTSYIPDYVCELIYNEAEERRFSEIRGSHDTFLGFHGSKVENFHSILINGLRNNLNKTSLYGEGLYLSSDLKLALSFSPLVHQNWKYSVFGSQLGCIAVCDVIDHPDVKCSREHMRASSGSNATSTRKRTSVAGSMGGEIPDKYFVVRNDDLIRVKYVLVYSPRAHKQFLRDYLQGKASSTLLHHPSRTRRSFFERNRFVLLMAAYVFVLALVNVLSSDKFARFKRRHFGY